MAVFQERLGSVCRAITRSSHWAALAYASWKQPPKHDPLALLHILNWEKSAAPPATSLTQQGPMNTSVETALLALHHLGSQAIKPALRISHTLVKRDLSGWEVGLGAPYMSLCHPGAAREPTALSASCSAPCWWDTSAKMGMTAAQFQCRKTLT